ncbi:MAG TPA: hypothetical protein VLT13_11125 [Bacteroidota bacterium]|nr:hypothetical protein [Bacteroidota bacterium]
MNPSPLIPLPDVIPAPAWLFHVLDVALFSLHILLINVILGGSLILLFSRFGKADEESPAFSALATKLPVSFALGINLGVAPLLFLQVIYGHLFYSSSILLGVFWIVIIPLLIIAYYAAYVHAKTKRTPLATAAIAVASVILLYVSFIFVNNILTMMQPETWSAYFVNRTGTILLFSDQTLIPRYLHFLVASIAVAGLASATVWAIRKKRGSEGADGKIRHGLRIFGYATIAEVAIGLWFLIALKRDIMLQFMGGDLTATIVFALGFLCGIGAIATAFGNNYRATLSMAILTILAMVITRDQLRSMYLQGSFDPASLQVNPQYGVLILFLVILAIGLASVAWMLKAGFRAPSGRTQQ